MTEQSAEHRGETRWSASKEADVVLRLLRGEPIDEVSRELGVECTGWRPGASSSWLRGRSG